PAAPILQPLGYEVWSWQRWREITGEQRPSLKTAQSVRADLVELLPKERISSTDWKARTAEIRKTLDVFVGTPPAAAPPLDAQTESESTLEGGIVRRRFRFQVEPGEFVPAYLLIPPGSGKLPAVVCPHQTTQYGKDEPAGIRGNPRLAMALALARRGYVTLTYDAACFGERHTPATGHYGEALAFYEKHPRWSLMGKMTWDLSRAVDYLLQQPFVDPARIASAGHSHGGYTTWSSMAYDERISVGVSSCGYDTIRYDGNPFRWSHATALLPRLGFYLSSPYINMRNYVGVPDSEVIEVPFDVHQILALAAPRPLFLTASDDDHIFPNAGWSTRQTEARLRPVYELFHASEKFETLYFRGGHGFPPENETRAFAFIDRWLRP
ncbi:MAG: prolyl oligopeptidase family serine peptidase, partial [Acidobacteria bacterium]|nr:prolyl oligopeptidase family serine peptidase [Acidobacteriota bacterium]